MAEDPLALLPEIVLLAGVVGTLLLALWTPRQAQVRVRALGLVALAVSAGTAVPPLLEAPRAVYDGTWVVDPLTGAVRVSAAVGAILVLALSAPTFRHHAREGEVTVLVLLCVLGTNALAAAGDLLMLSAAFLLASVPLYALVAFRKDAAATEAALKYYLVGALCGVLLLVGTAAVVLATGATGYEAVAAGLTNAPAPLAAVGVLGVLIGVLFKVGAVPAHFWVPDTVSGTTTAVAALVTTVPKLGGVAAVQRLATGPFEQAPVDVVLVLAVIATASMTLGNLAAFRQDDVHRLLAYSSISQVGYLLVIAAAAPASVLAEPALVVYLLGYAITNVGAFAVVAARPQARSLSQWSGLARQNPWLAGALVVHLLGLVGTPPTVVFVGKLLAFGAAADAGLVWLVVVAAINTVASLYYYLRWLGPAYGRAQLKPAATAPAPAAVAVASAVLVVMLGVGSGLVVLVA